MNDTCKNFYKIYLSNKNTFDYIPFFQKEGWYNIVYKQLILSEKSEHYVTITEKDYNLLFFIDGDFIAYENTKGLYFDYSVNSCIGFLGNKTHGVHINGDKIGFFFLNDFLK